MLLNKARLCFLLALSVSAPSLPAIAGAEMELHYPMGGLVASDSRKAVEADRERQRQIAADKAMCLEESSNLGIETRYTYGQQNASYVAAIRRGSGSSSKNYTYYWDGKKVSRDSGYSRGRQKYKYYKYSGGYTTYWYRYEISGPAKSEHYDWCIEQGYPTKD